MGFAFYLLLLPFCFVLAAISPWMFSKRSVVVKDQIKIIAAIALLAIPVSGALAGTFVSHGFDVPWWVFGLVNSVGIIFGFTVSCLLMKMLNKLKDNKME